MRRCLNCAGITRSKLLEYCKECNSRLLEYNNKHLYRTAQLLYQIGFRVVRAEANAHLCVQDVHLFRDNPPEWFAIGISFYFGKVYDVCFQELPSGWSVYSDEFYDIDPPIISCTLKYLMFHPYAENLYRQRGYEMRSVLNELNSYLLSILESDVNCVWKLAGIL